MSGDDATALAFTAQGGDGCLSVTSNVAPRLCRALFAACRQGELAQVRLLATMAARLTTALLRESNPTPLKYALSRMRLMAGRVRLPLVEPTSETKAEIDAALAQAWERYPGYLVGTPPKAERGRLERVSEMRQQRARASLSELVRSGVNSHGVSA